MNILMLDSETTWRGGEAQLDLLMRGLKENGFEPALACPSGSRIGEKEKTLGFQTFDVSMSGGVDVKGALQLRSLLKRRPFDIIHAHASHAHSIAFLATRGLRARPRLVVSRRVDFAVGRNRFSALKYKHGADVYLAISNGVKKVLIESGISEDRIRVVPSGIDLSKFDRLKGTDYLRTEFSLDQPRWIIGNIAALAPHKAQQDFIEAAAIVERELGEVKFFIVGEGKLLGPLQRQAAEKNMTAKIIFTGFRSDPLEILSTFHCFVISSHLEGLCTSIMDAQVLGVPVAATDTGGIPDLIDHEQTGLLSPPGQPKRMAENIVRLLTDPVLSERCRILAKKKATEYDYRNTVQKTIAAYEHVLAGENGS
jgi:glycosyltransferase involved in cell wall biosynthesis